MKNTNDAVTPGNELLAEFMGYEIVDIGYFGCDDETQWQRDNADYIRDSGIESVGRYAVHKIDKSWELMEEMNYDTDWNLLIPVLFKWNCLPITTRDTEINNEIIKLTHKIERKLVTNYMIHEVFQELLEAVVWYKAMEINGKL